MRDEMIQIIAITLALLIVIFGIFMFLHGESDEVFLLENQKEQLILNLKNGEYRIIVKK